MVEQDGRNEKEEPGRCAMLRMCDTPLVVQAPVVGSQDCEKQLAGDLVFDILKTRSLTNGIPLGQL